MPLIPGEDGTGRQTGRAPHPVAESGCLGLAGRALGGSSWALVQLQGGVEGESLSWAQRNRPGLRQPWEPKRPSESAAATRPTVQAPPPPRAVGLPVPRAPRTAIETLGSSTQHPAPNQIPWLVPPKGGCRRRGTGLSGVRAPSQGVNQLLSQGPPPCPPTCWLGGVALPGTGGIASFLLPSALPKLSLLSPTSKRPDCPCFPD